MDRSYDNNARDTASNTNQANESAIGNPSDHHPRPRSGKGRIGQVRSRGNGSGWQYIYDAPRHPDGRRLQVTRGGYATRNAAEVALQTAISTAEVVS